jgi:hypothetical protein
VPGGATTVSTIGALETALAGGTAVDIYLQNGSYSRVGPITPGAGHRLWGQSVTGVVLDFGLMWRDRSAWEMHGMTLNIADAGDLANNGDATPKTGGIVTWTSASANTMHNARISDCVVDLNHLGKYGIYLGRPGGAKVQRCVLRNCPYEGLYAFNNNASSLANWLASTVTIDAIEDLDISGIYDSPRGAQDGREEYGLIVGHPVTGGVRRIRARDLGWGGMATIGKCLDTVFEDLEMDEIYGTIPAGSPTSSDDGYMTGQGPYLEVTTRRCTFRRFRIGPDVQRGFAMEWDENKNYRLTSTYTIGDTSMSMQYGGTSDVVIPAAGTVYIGEGENPPAVTYTGKTIGTPLVLTGCSGGSGGPYAVGTLVSTWPGGRQACDDIVIEQGTILCQTSRGSGDSTARSRRGISMDDGTGGVRVRDVSIRGPKTIAGAPSGANGSALMDNTGVPHAGEGGSSELVHEYVDGQTGLESGAVFVETPSS